MSENINTQPVEINEIPAHREAIEATQGSLALRAALERAREIDDRGYDWFFDDNRQEYPGDELQGADKEAFDRWQIEKAAIRPKKFGETLQGVEKDSFGTYRPTKEQSRAIVDALAMEWGIEREKPRDAQADISHAKQLVASGQAPEKLRSLEFMQDRRFGEITEGGKLTIVALDGDAIEVPARKLVGAEGFSSWMGRGNNGLGEVADRQTNEKHASIEQIENYATRETELPYMDSFGLEIALTDKGPVFYSFNAHRAGAAQLQNSRVRSKFVRIYDVRGMAEKAYLVDQAIAITEHNSNIQ